jgi:hypothetical protein
VALSNISEVRHGGQPASAARTGVRQDKRGAYSDELNRHGMGRWDTRARLSIESERFHHIAARERGGLSWFYTYCTIRFVPALGVAGRIVRQLSRFRDAVRHGRRRSLGNAPQGDTEYVRSTRKRLKPASDYFELRASPIAGQGAFATRKIRKGTRLVEYTGEAIDQEEADRRYDDDNMVEHHTFLFILDDDVVIDAGVGGNEARFINHSCDPNCDAVIEDGHIYIEAIRTIAPGEELAYDYAYEREGPLKLSWLDLYACRCGSPKCRGTIIKWVREGRRRVGVKRAAAEAQERAAGKTGRRSLSRRARAS